MDVGKYVVAVNKMVRLGGVGEHSIRSVFLPQLRAAAADVEAIDEPRATEHGNPDISVNKSGVPIGWVETKSLITSLDNFEQSEQFDRYIRGFANLLVTNFNEFRWYLNHDRAPIRAEKIGGFTLAGGLTVSDDRRVSAGVPSLLSAFCDYETQQARTANELAQRLATFALAVRQTVVGILVRRDDDVQLRQELEAFRAVLIPNLSEVDFADMYAQTIAYGLFAARCYHLDFVQFDRFSAPQLLPLSNPFLRNIFGSLAGSNLDVRVSSVVDQICLLLRTAELAAIVSEFHARTGLADPVVHFYETFLQTYDRDVRKDRGVYYTPIAVVSFINRSTDELLKHRLGVTSGLADSSRIRRDDREVHRMQILDPATGTGTFLLYLIDYLKGKFGSQGGLWNAFVHEELLPRMYGFEYLMAPYAIAHLKIGMALAGQNFTFESRERLGVYLTNALEDTSAALSQLPFQTFLTTEANEANQIKQQRPIMVIVGNPPYSVRSGNLGPNARRLVSRYKILDGNPIREGGTLALQRSVENDYVKFIAFAQEQIERNGEGVVGYITANGYLDQPTLAGLRRSLMTAFDEIRIIDLHGYTRAGGSDENVFSQIGEGVAVLLLVRKGHQSQREATVDYHSLKGKRVEKRAWLSTHNAFDIDFERIDPSAPDYSFRPENLVTRSRYRGDFIGLTEIFRLQRGAIVTARDSFAIDFTEAGLLTRLEAFRDHRGTVRQASEELGLKWSGDWPEMATQARDWLRRTANLREYIKPITYRPFDDRYVIYSDKFLDTPSSSVMENVVRGEGRNKLLLFGRSVRYGIADHVFVTSKLAEAKAGEASRQCHAAPLFLYENDLIQDSKLNFSDEFLRRVEEVWHDQLEPDAIFGYIYGILNSPRFREVFATQLCADYARIPLLPLEVASQIAELGSRLVKLHVGVENAPLVTEFPIAARETLVAKMSSANRWRNTNRHWKLFINQDQFISGVPEEAKTTRIAGYAVLEKWLQGREGMPLRVVDVTYLQQVIARLDLSARISSNIDDFLQDLADPT